MARALATGRGDSRKYLNLRYIVSMFEKIETIVSEAPSLIGEDDPPVFEVVNAGSMSKVLLHLGDVCVVLKRVGGSRGT